MRVTPLHITLLIHCHVILAPIPNRGAPAVEEYLANLMLNQLISPSDHSKSGFVSTERGRKWLEMLLATPLPIRSDQWIDPRERSNNE